MKTLNHTTFTFSLTDEMIRMDARMEAQQSKDARKEAHVSKDAPIPAGRCLCSRYSRPSGVPQSPLGSGDTNRQEMRAQGQSSVSALLPAAFLRFIQKELP